MQLVRGEVGCKPRQWGFRVGAAVHSMTSHLLHHLGYVTVPHKMTILPEKPTSCVSSSKSPTLSELWLPCQATGITIFITRGFCEAACDYESSLFRARSTAGAQRMLTAASPLAISGEARAC